jgi:hypothetical protein
VRDPAKKYPAFAPVPKVAVGTMGDTLLALEPAQS